MSIINEFKEFISKGNVLDLAVGVVIGGAFGKIVSGFVENVLMPPIGLILGGVDFSDLKFILKEASQKTNESGTIEAISEVAINYGLAIQSIIDFLIIAFFIFLLIKGVNKLKKEKVTEEVPASPSNEEILLTQIRDLLKK